MADVALPSHASASLSPAVLLNRSAQMFADRIAVIDGDRRLTYADLLDRRSRLVAALAGSGIGAGDRVAALCTNSYVMIELHQAVPAAGAVLVALNTRWSTRELAYVVRHSGARLLVASRELEETARELAAEIGVPVVLESEYEQWLLDAPAPGPVPDVPDEAALLAINYTSGTTGTPKGVMYAHRGAYLQAVAMAYHTGIGPGTSYLWTLPMFHCNGWMFPWAVTAVGGTHVCLRAIDAGRIWKLLREHGITHLSAAPTVLTMIAEHEAAGVLERRVQVSTGGSPPSPDLLARLDGLGLDVTHLYGLTETYGPIAINVWQPEWDSLEPEVAARLRARQGVANLTARPLRVLDDAGKDVPGDGATMGEIVVSGNNVMVGYYQDPGATAAALVSGCLRTGDLGVLHPDGYIELRDRLKDLIVSGGENISSVEVEQAIDSHPDVVESAVVAAPHPRWGEVPMAFVVRRPGSALSASDLITYLDGRLARFKVPRRIEFDDIPKTPTGKIQKNVLRERLRAEA